MKKFVMPCLAISLTACATTPAIFSEKSSSNEGPGISYYLPKRLLKIELSRAAVTAAPADVSAAEAAVKASKTVEAAAKEANETAVADAAQGRTDGVSTVIQDSLDKTEFKTKLQLAAATKSREEADKGLAKVKADVALRAGQPGIVFSDTVTVTQLALVPDTKRRYVARLQHHWRRSDNFDLKTTASGLLSTSDVKSTDHTSDILLAAVQAFSGFQSITTLGWKAPLPVRDAAPDCKDAQEPIKMEFIVDPSVEDQLKAMNADFVAANACYAFSLQDPVLSATMEEDKAKKGGTATGLYYRRNLPYNLVIKRNGRHVKAVAFDMPNSSPTDRIEVPSPNFTEVTSTTTFQDGMLLQHVQKQPSEGLAIAKVPVDILKALVAIPAEILSLKVDYTNKNTDLLAAETKFLEAQVKLLEAQKAADEAKSKVP